MRIIGWVLWAALFAVLWLGEGALRAARRVRP